VCRRNVEDSINSILNFSVNGKGKGLSEDHLDANKTVQN